MSYLVDMLRQAKSDEVRRTVIALLGQMCQSEAMYIQSHTDSRQQNRFSEYLKTIEPVVQQSLESEDDELKEISMQTLEIFIIKCPAGMKEYVDSLLALAANYLKYDPNYAAEDESMASGDENGATDFDGDKMSDVDDEFAAEDEDFIEDTYTDEDDVAWKVRRGTCKLISGIIEAYPYWTPTIYSAVGQQLISRFADREEYVRVSSMSTFRLLVASTSAENVNNPGKRRRESDSSYAHPIASSDSQLKSFVHKLHDTLLTQTKPSSPILTRFTAFELATDLVRYLQSSLGGVEDYIKNIQDVLYMETQVSTVAGSGVTTSNLKLCVIDFVDALVKLDSLEVFGPALDELLPLLLTNLREKSYKFVIDTLTLVSYICITVHKRRTGNPAYIEQIVSAIRERVNDQDIDINVREKAIQSLGSCLAEVGSDVSDDLSEKSLHALADRLMPDSTRLASIQAICELAGSDYQAPHAWLQLVINHLSSFLRKNSRNVRTTALSTLEILAQKYADIFPEESFGHIGQALTADEGSLQQQACRTLLHILVAQPSKKDQIVKAMPSVQSILEISSIQGRSKASKAIGDLFKATAKATGGGNLLSALQQCNERISVPLLASVMANTLEGSPAEEVDKIVAMVKSPKLTEQSKILNVASIGYYGLSKPLGQDVYDTLVELSESPNVAMVSSASIALGCLAAGSSDLFLPQLITTAAAHPEHRIHYLQALKEVSVYLSSSQNLNI